MIVVEMHSCSLLPNTDSSIGFYGKTIGKEGFVSLDGDHYSNSVCLSRGRIQYKHIGASVSLVAGIDDSFPGSGKVRIIINGQVVGAAVISSKHKPVKINANSFVPGAVMLEFIPGQPGTRAVFADMHVSLGLMEQYDLKSASPFTPSSISFHKSHEINLSENSIDWGSLLSTYAQSYKVISPKAKLKTKTLWDYLRIECGVTQSQLDTLNIEYSANYPAPPDSFSMNYEDFQCAYHWLLELSERDNLLYDHFALQYRQSALLFLAMKEVGRVRAR